MPITTEREDVLKQIYDRYYHKLLFYAGRYLEDPDDAKDIVQDIFVKLWENRLSFQNGYALSAYLYSGVYHRCMNHLVQSGIHRRHHRKLQELYRDNLQVSYVNDRIEMEVLQEMFSAIDSLPEECRKVFEMSYIDGLDIARVAENLQISPNTVKSQRARGRRLLKERLSRLFPLFVIYFNL